MAKQRVNYVFENPNGNDVFAQVLRKVLIEKLAARQREKCAVA